MHHSELYYFLTIMTFCVGHQLTETEQQNLNNNMDSMKERDLHTKEKSSNGKGNLFFIFYVFFLVFVVETKIFFFRFNEMENVLLRSCHSIIKYNCRFF
jgi:hypothetical protein